MVVWNNQVQRQSGWRENLPCQFPWLMLVNSLRATLTNRGSSSSIRWMERQSLCRQGGKRRRSSLRVPSWYNGRWPSYHYLRIHPAVISVASLVRSQHLWMQGTSGSVGTSNMSFTYSATWRIVLLTCCAGDFLETFFHWFVTRQRWGMRKHDAMEETYHRMRRFGSCRKLFVGHGFASHACKRRSLGNFGTKKKNPRFPEVMSWITKQREIGNCSYSRSTCNMKNRSG